jgi:alanine-synthesizing transaminase
VHRACGLRTGWVVFNGKKAEAADYLEGLEVLASLRLCANVPGQWTVPIALSAPHDIAELTSDAGRLGRQRRAVLRGVAECPFLDVVVPRGALYAFPAVDLARIPHFDDQRFAMELLEREHVLVVPGSSFNVPYRNHLRFTFLPDEDTLAEVFVRLNRMLDLWAKRV